MLIQEYNSKQILTTQELKRKKCTARAVIKNWCNNHGNKRADYKSRACVVYKGDDFTK